MPSIIHVYLHPLSPYMDTSIGMIIPVDANPTPIPADTIPVALPLYFKANHIDGKAIAGKYAPPFPSPVMNLYITNSRKLFANPVRIMLILIARVEIVMIILDPYLLANAPPIVANIRYPIELAVAISPIWK